MNVKSSGLQPGLRLALLCLAALIAAGCGAATSEPPPAPATLPPALPHSAKGYELYSWPVAGRDAWRHLLITATNRLKTPPEIVAADTAILDGDWVQLPLAGTQALQQALARLPKGETITWIGAGWLEQMGQPAGQIRLPNPDLVTQVETYAQNLGLQLQLTP